VRLRTRIALAASISTAVVAIGVAFVAYRVTENVLLGDIDRALVHDAQARQPLDHGQGGPDHGEFGGNQAGKFGGPGSFAQLIDGSGQPQDLPPDETPLPVDPRAAAVATGAAPVFSTVRRDNLDVRVYTKQVSPGLALQVARPLNEAEASLNHLRSLLLWVAAGGIALAVVLGLLVADRGLKPVRRLASAVDHVARTHDLSHRVPAEGDDEPAILARRFNELLEGLSEAQAAQDRLIADASHELRTPLTALRANVELLAQPGVELDPAERTALAADVAAQLDVFGRMVDGLVELARGDRGLSEPAPVQLDDVVREAVDRARAVFPGVEFALAADAVTVDGDDRALGRAVWSLLENAATHGKGPVEVRLDADELSVRDHGPGVAEGDRERIFGRFVRGAAAGELPGSGIGLAVVAQVATAHGMATRLEDADGGGARFVVAIHPGVTAGPVAVGR
jgi:two-component system, OmpR family, sensor histidine kinase MprB